MDERMGTESRHREPARAAPDWLARLPYMIVLSGVGAGLVLCSFHYFRKGSVLIAAALLFGALLRMLLPESRVGMLAIRTRAIDSWTLVFLGEFVAFVALSVPPTNRPGLVIAAASGVLVAVVFVVRGVRFLLSRRRAGHTPV